MAKNKKEKSKENENGKSGSKLMIIVVLLLVLLIGAVSFTGYLFLTKNKGEAEKKVVVQAFYELGTFSFNLNDEGRSRYGKISVSLGYDSTGKLAETLPTVDTVLKDFVNSKLMSKKADELKSDGIPKLKKELIDGINAKLQGEDKVLNVYFKEILIQ